MRGNQISNAIAQGDTEPCDNDPEESGEAGMPAGRKRGDGERLGATPPLHPRGQDKWQPMGRDRRVEKRDAKSGDGNGRENGVGHRIGRQINSDLHR